MDDIIARIKQRHGSRKRKIEVPELADITSHGGAFVFYVQPWTVADNDSMAGKMGEDAPIANYVDVLIRKAENEKGEKIFTPDQAKDIAEHLEPGLLSKLVAEVMNVPTPEEASGNSQ